MSSLFITIGIVGVMVWGVMIGTLVDNYEQKSQFYGQAYEGRLFKAMIAKWSGILGLLFLIIGLIVYWVSK